MAGEESLGFLPESFADLALFFSIVAHKIVITSQYTLFVELSELSLPERQQI